jgi:hypothetical protein
VSPVRYELGFYIPQDAILHSDRRERLKSYDMSVRQRDVIEFLVKEGIPAAEIHQRLQRACGGVCTGASSVRR